MTTLKTHHPTTTAGKIEQRGWLTQNSPDGVSGLRETGRYAKALLPLVLAEGDAEGLEEVDIVVGEGAFSRRAVRKERDGGLGFRLNFIEADGGFKHKKDVEALLPDILDDAGDVLGLGDGLVDSFAELLDQVFDLLVHILTQ